MNDPLRLMDDPTLGAPRELLRELSRELEPPPDAFGRLASGLGLLGATAVLTAAPDAAAASAAAASSSPTAAGAAAAGPAAVGASAAGAAGAGAAATGAAGAGASGLAAHGLFGWLVVGLGAGLLVVTGAEVAWHAVAPAAPAPPPRESLVAATPPAPERPREQRRALPPAEPTGRVAAPLATATAASGRAASSLAAEVRAVEAARQLLRSGDPGGALAELDRFEAMRSSGTLRPEAELLRIEAEVARGGRERAARLAAVFVARYPTSPHGDRLRAELLTPAWP